MLITFSPDPSHPVYRLHHLARVGESVMGDDQTGARLQLPVRVAAGIAERPTVCSAYDTVSIDTGMWREGFVVLSISYRIATQLTYSISA